jgi:integrase
MNAAIIKRGRRYAVRLDLGRGPDGRRIYKYHSGYPTRKAAQQARTELLGALDRRSYVAPDKTTVAEYLRGQWLPAIQTRVRPGTWVEYRRKVDTHLIPALGQVPLQQLTTAMLNAHYQQLLAGGTGARTVQYVHATIRKALNDAVRWGLLVRNPAQHAAPPRPRRGELRTWTADELRRFLDGLQDERLYAAWRLAALTGMRRGEVLGLRWADLDLDGAWLSVRQTLIVVDNHPQLSQPKTARGGRRVALDPGTVASLRVHHKAQAAERLAAGPTWTHSDLVFSRQDGALLHPEYIRRQFERHIDRAGLPRIRFHDLRHTHATLALQAGVHPKVVSERLGHTTVALTLDIYSHAIPAMQQEAAVTIAGLISGRGLGASANPTVDVRSVHDPGPPDHGREGML